MSGYQYNGVDLNDIVYASGTKDNSEGYVDFPGSKQAPGNVEQIGINNFKYQTNINLLSSRLASFDNYNTTTNEVDLPVGVNYISVLLIGASGGGGGGGGVDTGSTSNYSGGGGGQGGLYNIHMTNKIDTSVFLLKSYNVIVGAKGTGGLAGDTGNQSVVSSGSRGNSGGVTSITLVSNTTASYGISVSGGTFGNGGGFGTGLNVANPGNGNAGNNGTDCSITFNNGSLPSATYLMNSARTNNSNSKNSASRGFTGSLNRSEGGISNVTHAINDIGPSAISSTNLNYTFDNIYGRGGDGGAGGVGIGARSIATGGSNGINGFVRVYYFYN